MAIDPLSEEIVSLTNAAKGLPERRAGKRPHTSCLYRWTKNGCRGVVLESIQIGATRCTSKEALVRFFQRLTRANESTPETEPNGPTPEADVSTPEAPRSPACRRRAAERAERELEREGV